MSQLGNTTLSFGREYNISTANCGGDQILASEALRANTLIANARIGADFNDTGSYSLFMTDGKGMPVRLTYTIQPGNGLYVDQNDPDVLHMQIDNNSIMADDGDELYVNKHNIIDGYTLAVNSVEGDSAKRGRISVVTANLDPATDVAYGIASSDRETFTTYIDPETPGQIRVNTQYLDTVDDDLNRDGIVRHSSLMSRTIKATDGKLQVETQNLEKADDASNKYGIVQGDRHTIFATEGIITVNTEGLDHASNTNFGIVKGDARTVNISDGVASVITSGLDHATTERYGTVCLDGYSIDVSPNNGKIEVKRFPEIEALLETNNSEHENFARDIEDLKNRVSDLETLSLMERIDFLNFVGDPTTELPEPEFDKTIWNIKNRYSDIKTISFQIRTNCKYYVNVDYKPGTNNKNQVDLISVKCGAEQEVSKNSLANTPFAATNNTVQTLYLKFRVSNYEENNNIASTNTTVIVTTASINDAAIKKTSFHIFKCWNNSAYMEDEPEYPQPDPPVPTNSYWIIHENTRNIEVSKNTSYLQTNTIAYNKTGSKNFYFNTYVYASYYDGPAGYITISNQRLEQSSTIGNGIYDINRIEYSSDNVNFSNNKSTAGVDWVSASITASYNSTKQFNVLTLSSTKNMVSEDERTAYVRIYLNSEGIKNSVAGSLNDLPVKSDKTSLEKISDFNTTELGKVNAVINSSLFNDIGTDENIGVIVNAKSTVTTSNIQNTSLASIIRNDIDKFNDSYRGFELLEKELASYTKSLNDEATYNAYYTYIETAAKYADIITDKTNAFNESLKNSTSYIGDRFITFIYKEKLDYVNPVINVTTSISSLGGAAISYVVTRNSNSLLNNNNWGVSVKYNFVNKNGDIVNADGNSTPATDYSIPTIYPGTAITYNGKYTHADITKAASGYRQETETKYTYYNVVAISYNSKDNKSLWGIGSGNKDVGMAYWGGYVSSTGGTVASISDDVYLVFKLTGQDAKISSSQKYSFYSMPLKGKASGTECAFEQADDIVFMGISKYKYTKASVASYSNELKLGSTVYVMKHLARTSIATGQCKQAAAAEKTLLNTVAKEYYDRNKSVLVLNTSVIPTQVANNITGIKIKSVTITPTTAFAGTPTISYSSIGSWNSNTNTGGSTGGSTGGTTTNNYTFGNATVSSVHILDWDDLSMTLEFYIRPGSTTNIPNGATIINSPTGSTGGTTRFTFIQNSKSYDYGVFYNSYSFTSTTWSSSTGCTVTYKLYNQYSVTRTTVYAAQALLYNKEFTRLQTYYLVQPIRYVQTDNSRDMSYMAVPLLTDFTAIKFWFGLNVSGYTLQKRFESSTSSTGVQVTIAAHYNKPVIKSVSIVNALYSSVQASSY